VRKTRISKYFVSGSNVWNSHANRHTLCNILHMRCAAKNVGVQSDSSVYLMLHFTCFELWP